MYKVIGTTKHFVSKFFFRSAMFYAVLISLFFIFFTTISSLSNAQSTQNCAVVNGLADPIIQGFGFPTYGNSSLCDTIRVNASASEPSAVTSLRESLGASAGSYYDAGMLGMLVQTSYFTQHSSSSYGVQGATWVADKLSNTVSAQSSALQGLSPILVIHGIGRNIAYVLVAIALVIVGLATYFSKKGSKEEVPAVTSIADIVIALILVTISFPIGGIVVDLVINLGNALIAALLDPFINAQTILSALNTSGSGTNILGLLSDFQNTGTSSSVINLIQAGLSNLSVPLNNSQAFINSTIYGFNFPSIGIKVGNSNIGVSTADIFTGIASVIFHIASKVLDISANQPLITAIIAFTVFVIIFRIVFGLLGAFVGIILTIAFSPFILIPGAFPGVNAITVFTNWIKRLIATALIFPVTFGMIMLSAIFLNLTKTDTSTNCVYDSSSSSKVQITGSYKVPNYSQTLGNVSTNQNVNTGTTTPGTSSYFDTTRFQQGSSVAGDPYSATRYCFPILLPPQFNWLPAPIGNLGTGFSIDDFTRFVIGIALLVMIPNINKILKDAFKLKDPSYASLKDAMEGANLLTAFVGTIPVVGAPIARIAGELTKAIK